MVHEARHAERPSVNYRIPLVLTPQAEGGYSVTSPLLPELVTEGDSVADAIDNARDAFAAVVELYEDLGRSLPQSTWLPPSADPLWLETVLSAP